MWALLAIFFVILCETVSGSQVCDFEKSVELVNRTYAGFTFRSNETFVDPKTKTERGCVCLKGTCARKCCPFGQVYKSDSRTCHENIMKFDPPVLEGKNNQFIFKEGFNATQEFIFITRRMDCVRDEGERRVQVYPVGKHFNLTTDGNLLVGIPDVSKTYGPDKYCIDTFVSDQTAPHLNALICFIPEPERNNYGVSSSCMLISCFFILLTIAVYACLPELRNLHGMVLMTNLLCFFVGFLVLAIMQIFASLDMMPQLACIVLTFVVYFSVLAAFFWLNIMCYDIWWTFSGNRAHAGPGSPKKRFMYYAVYAFGVPTALTILLGALEFSDMPVQHALLPNLRTQGCFIYGNSKLLYLYGPITLLCVANMIFFGLTAFKIWRIKTETKVLRSKESSTHAQDRKDAQRFILYIKLFIIMGINWIMEVISSFYPDSQFYWQFFDAYNTLVGLIIFIIFVCKKKTLIMMRKRYEQLRGDPLSATQTTMSTTKTQSSSEMKSK